MTYRPDTHAPAPGHQPGCGTTREQLYGETRFPQPPACGLCPPTPSHRVGLGGNPLSPRPCARAASSPSRGRGDGGTWFPHVHLSRPYGSAAPRRDEHRLGARAARPRRGSAGKVTAPLPSPPPAGGRESGSSPQRGEVRRGGQRRMRVGEQPMFTVAVHAALPHHAAMNIRLFLGGRSPPKPSRGWGHGETRFPHAPAGRGRGETPFPHTPLREPMFTLAVHATLPHTDGMKTGCSWEGCVLPNPPAGGGVGKPGFPNVGMPPAGQPWTTTSNQDSARSDMTIYKLRT